MNWNNLKGDGIKIAIVDSGTNTSRREFNEIYVENIDLTSDYCLDNEHIDNIGHGTATSYILHNHLPEARIYSIKIFDKNHETNIEDLIRALKYIITTLDVDIIHLSNGVTFCDKIDDLEEICSFIENKGIITVAAFDNLGAISYPAAFDSVLGVDYHTFCTEAQKYYYVENSIVNIMGIGALQRLPWDEGYKRVAGSSFAAPHITAIVAKIMQSGIRDKKKILIELKNNAMKVVNYSKRKIEKPDWINKINKAIIFPFNKEMHSLLRFRNELTFSIKGVYEPRRHNKWRDTEKLKGIMDLKIESIDEIDWESDFDTVILGHTSMLNSVYNRDFYEFFIQSCLEHSKNLYSFDDLSAYQGDIDMLKKDNKIYYPIISEENVPESNMDKLHRIPQPVLGVFGTSPRQGKFTLQMTLRKLLCEKGYRVGQLGTEASSLLFGMNEVYPMGYNSSVNVSGGKAISTVNELMYNISRNDPDIILVGSQSQTVPYSAGNIGFYPNHQHDFLLGSEPDAIILCVNPNDDLTYINRTINYLENYIETKVIAISIFPVEKDYNLISLIGDGDVLNQKQIEEKKEFMKEYFKKPTFLIGSESDNERLVVMIENFFGE
ncbi:S8 family serine peptidase [Paenibacillus sp. TSA_86.1]|uniref:S8 family serine peptidase n=1 Tax=Paenibacillus sp. TSA_86.1 TaxID=3415649 RepID=UPI0040464A74